MTVPSAVTTGSGLGSDPLTLSIGSPGDRGSALIAIASTHGLSTLDISVDSGSWFVWGVDGSGSPGGWDVADLVLTCAFDGTEDGLAHTPTITIDPLSPSAGGGLLYVWVEIKFGGQRTLDVDNSGFALFGSAVPFANSGSIVSAPSDATVTSAVDYHLVGLVGATNGGAFQPTSPGPATSSDFTHVVTADGLLSVNGDGRLIGLGVDLNHSPPGGSTSDTWAIANYLQDPGAGGFPGTPTWPQGAMVPLLERLLSTAGQAMIDEIG